jgi:NAD(P)H-dependent FMN reductase
MAGELTIVGLGGSLARTSRSRAALQVALDGASRGEPPYLHDKVVGLISAAGGTQGLQAINTMEFVVRALRGWAVRACRGFLTPSISSHE